MKKIFRHSRAGFTMVEMMIVVAIVGILMGISVLPYGDYMDRARLSNNVDSIAQEWILAHKEVRNGRFFEGTENHATIILDFDEEKNSIKKYLYKWEMQDNNGKWELKNPPTNLETDSNAKLDKEISLDKNIKFFWKNFSTQNEKFTYIITPPHGDGKFYENGSESGNEATIMIGFPSNDENSTKIKKIFLREYLK